MDSMTAVTVQQLHEITGIPIRTIKDRCARGIYSQTLTVENGGDVQRIPVATLPSDIRQKYFTTNDADKTTDCDAQQYAEAPDYAKRKADKYLQILRACNGDKGHALRQFVGSWNTAHPENKTSYQSIMRVRTDYQTHGIVALLGKWGKRRGKSSVSQEAFDYFRSLYLKEGGPSAMSCWRITLGHIRKAAPDTDINTVPSHMAFLRRLEKDTPKDAIYRARHGYRAWERRYGMQIIRDYSNVMAGQCWVSDHAQIDAAVSYHYQGKLRVAFPWSSAWRDLKTGKWLGWCLHIDPPNSDHIFSSFHRAGIDHGICTDIYIDNGKDFRSRDFSGGRKVHKLELDETRARSLTGLLGITVHFSLPYNAQSKPIERDHLIIKEWLSKHYHGYRGGNVVERPERLQDEINKGNIMPFVEFSKIFDTFITEVLNRTRVNNARLGGMCPDELWEQEAPKSAQLGKLRAVSEDALMLFCSRTSGDMTIGRNGVYDSQLGQFYFADWMMGCKGRKVFLRRDINRYQEAWVFDSRTNEFIDKASIFHTCDALAETDVAREQLREVSRLKAQNKKIIAAYASAGEEPSIQEKIGNMAAAMGAINERAGYVPSPIAPPDNYQITDMDIVQAEKRRKDLEGLQDISKALPAEERKPKKQLYLLASDRYNEDSPEVAAKAS